MNGERDDYEDEWFEGRMVAHEQIARRQREGRHQAVPQGRTDPFDLGYYQEVIDFTQR
jgi:hypothetical protein